MALIFLGAFFWANKSGQHEDTYTPSVRILFDDDPVGDVSHSEPTSLDDTEPKVRKNEKITIGEEEQ